MRDALSILPADEGMQEIADTPLPVIKTLVVGFAPDETGVRAFAAAEALAQCFDAQLVLVRSVARPAWGVVDVSYESLLEDFLDAERQRMQQAADRLTTASLCRRQLKIGFEGPEELLRATAREVKADLMVLGSHGTRGLEALLLGSVSRSMGLLSECPVLVVPCECSSTAVKGGPILFASDLQGSSIRTATYASAIARQWTGDLIAMHVLSPSSIASASEQIWKEDHARGMLRIALGRAMGDDRVRYKVPLGEAATEIVAEALRSHATLIVVGGGTHRTGVDHIPWETVSEVLRTAQCPVLIVPADCR